jgi:hypothetical protein
MLFDAATFKVSNITGANFIVGMTVNPSSAGSAFPTGVTGYGKLQNSGGVVFGLFGRADLMTNGSTVNELNSFNFAGKPSGRLPPDEGFGTKDYFTTPLQLVAFGSYPSSIGLQITRSSVAGNQPFIDGLYVNPIAVTRYGIFVDANATQGPSYGAVIKNVGTGINLQLQTTGSLVPDNAVVNVVQSNGTTMAAIKQSGDFVNKGWVLAANGPLTNNVSQTPGAAVDVIGSSTYRGTGKVSAVFRSSASAGSDSPIMIGSFNGNTPFLEAGRSGSGAAPEAFAFRIASTEFARTTAGGHFGVGTTTPHPITTGR